MTPMAPLPPELARVHMVGIGGAGMSGIARILLDRGALVSGSDAKESRGVLALRARGALINITQVGSGVATVQAAAGVSLNGVIGGSVALDGPWSGAALTKRGPESWVIQGALAGSVA